MNALIDTAVAVFLGGCIGYLIGQRRRVIYVTLDEDDS